MRRVKRYPLLRQEAFNEESEDDCIDSKPAFPVNFPENIYMIHPDLICIFNSIIPEQKSEDPDTLKKHISAEDATTPSRPVVLGGSFIFSNSCDGYISPTVIEKYESLAGDLSLDKENLLNIEKCLDKGIVTEDVGANQDIISFTTSPPCVESSPAMAEKPANPKKVELVGPYISPHKKDIITFFLTDIGRQKTMEQDGACYGTSGSIETVGETTPDCVTAERDDKKDENNKDIISFLTAGTNVDADNSRKLSYSLSVPPPKSKADLRKPYFSLNFSDIISFYNSEESLLHACSMNSDQEPQGLDSQKEADDIVQDPKSPDKEKIPANNPDQFVFQNDRSANVNKVLTSTPKSTLKKRTTPMMIHQGSVISFYSNEQSFLSALEVSSVDGDDINASAEDQDIEEAFKQNKDKCESTVSTANEQEISNSDIKVFSNRATEPLPNSFLKQPFKSEPQLRKSNSVLVVTEEFPDIISFYNPGADDTDPTSPAGTTLEVKDSMRKRENSTSLDTAEFGIIELPQLNENMAQVDTEVATAPDEEPFVVIENPASEEADEVNPDKFVFRNDRSGFVEKNVISPANQNVRTEEKQTPMMINQGSVITFYRNETSFLTALNSPNTVQTDESIENDINSPSVDVAEDEADKNVTSESNFDIKVYENTVLEHDTSMEDDNECLKRSLPDDDEEASIPEEIEIEDQISKPVTTNIKVDDASVPDVVKETEKEDIERLVHIVEMNEHNQDSDYDDDMPGLEECPKSIHESDLSENQDSLVVVEDSISEDGIPIRKLQDIENLPSIEKAIDMVNAIGGALDENLGMSVPEPLDDDYMYDDEEFERDITEEIDSLISEAEQLMMPTDSADNDALCDDLDRFFDEVDDVDELLLKAEPDEVPNLQIRNVSQNGETEVSPRDSSSESAIINFITQNIDKYMESTSAVDAAVATSPPTNVDPSTDDADDLVAHIDELLDVEDYLDIPGCETPEPPSPLRDTPTPQPHTPTVTRHLIRSTSLEDDGGSDEEYHTLFEALNKPILPPIPRVEHDEEDNQIAPAKSLTALQDYVPDPANISLQPSNNPCDPDSKVLSTGLLSEIVRHPLAGSLKRSASSGDTPGYHRRNPVTRSQKNDLLDEAHLFFLQNNIGVPSRGVGDDPSNREKKPSEDDQELSPISSLAQTLTERLTAHTAGRAGVKMVKPSDVVKIDKQLFGELQKKFSKPKEKMSSLRSKYKNRKKTANKWVPVQVVPSQVDISYDEVNPVDVEVRIPDLTERRTPIAKLFNDTSPPPAKSPSPPVRIVSPHPNVFIPIESPLPRKKFPSPKILRKVAMFEGLSLIDSRRRPVSPGPESKYLGSLENVADAEDSHDCECKTHPGKLTRQSRNWVSQDSGLYDGTLKPVSARKHTEMFQPTWKRNSPDPVEERPRSTSPYCQPFSEAAFGVNGSYIDNHVPASVRHPSRARNLSSDSNRENRIVQNSIGSQTNTHVDRLARSGSAASLAVVMASTFPNGGDPNFDLAGTAAKISQVCKSLSSSQTDITSCGVNLTRSRSMNSGMDVIHSTEVKRPTRPIYFDRNYSPSSAMRIRTTPENRVGQPVKAKKATASYREILKIQEKIKDANIISYQDLVRCPRNKLPPHVDKLQLQKYLSDTEFVDVFKMPREEFDKMAPWKQANLKKNVSLY